MGSPTHDGHHIYQSVDCLKPGEVHESIIQNNDPHSILTWDFDALRSNLKFTVYRTSKLLPNNCSKYIIACFTFLKAFQSKIWVSHQICRQTTFNIRIRRIRIRKKLFSRGAYLKLSSERKRSGKKWHFDSHSNLIVYSFSICILNQQGSHVMAHNGCYVLQWICPNECELPAQLMYFFEVLSSENYKGSMSNLQSGISAMSLASSCQSRW